MNPPEVSDLIQYIGPDGRLTVEGLKLFRQMIAVLRDHQKRIEDLEP